MNERYISMEEQLVFIDSEIEYAKLTGNFDKVTVLAEVRELIEKMPYIEVPQPKQTETTIYYMHTGERE